MSYNKHNFKTGDILTANQMNEIEAGIVENESAIFGKQEKLVSGTTIKTFNGQSLLGEGALEMPLIEGFSYGGVVEDDSSGGDDGGSSGGDSNVDTVITLDVQAGKMPQFFSTNTAWKLLDQNSYNTAIVPVTAGETYQLTQVMSHYQCRAYIFDDGNYMPVEVFPTAADTTKKRYDKVVTVPEGAHRLVLGWSGSPAPTVTRLASTAAVMTMSLDDGAATVDETKEGSVGYVLDVSKMRSLLGISESVASKKVEVAKSGTSIQVRTPLRGLTQQLACNFIVGGSNNKGLTISGYYFVDKPDKSSSIVTGTAFKGSNDDICPIKYNGSYMGGNHGQVFGLKVTATAHGKTEADIGSTWLSSSNSKNYIILSIIDANNLLTVCVGSNGSAIFGTITGTLTHVEGATNTADITITSSVHQQIVPAINRETVTIRSAEGAQLSGDGHVGSDEFVDIVDAYYIINLSAMVDNLKANVGKNTNTSYYSETHEGEVYYETTYRFFPSGCCLVIANVIPLRETISVSIFGGSQSQVYGTLAYVPFSTLDTPVTISSDASLVETATWRDESFPPHKFYQLDANIEKGFGIGYPLYGQTSAESRLKTASARAGWFDSSTKKLYPCIVYGSGLDITGSALTAYAWRTPVIKSRDGVFMTWYRIGEEYFVELEFMQGFNGPIELPVELSGKRLEVVKATDTVHIVGDVVSSHVYCVASESGSATIRCY